MISSNDQKVSDDVVDVVRKYIHVIDEKDDLIFKLTEALNRYKADNDRLQKSEKRCLELEGLHVDNMRDAKVLGASLQVLGAQLSKYETFMEDLRRELIEKNEGMFQYSQHNMECTQTRPLETNSPFLMDIDSDITFHYRNDSVRNSVESHSGVIEVGEKNKSIKDTSSSGGLKIATTDSLYIIQSMRNTILTLQRENMALCTRTTDYFPNIQETVNTIVTDVRQLLEDQMQAELQSSIFGNIKDQMLASEAMIRAKEALVLFMPSKQFSGISSDLSSTIPMGSHLSANEKATQSHQSNLHYVSRLPSELSLTLSSNDPFATLEVLANHHASVLNKLDEANLELQGLTADRDQWSTTCQEQCMSIISLESALEFLASSASDMLEDLGNAYTSFHGAVFGTGEKGNPFLSAAAVMGQEKSNNEALVHINNTLLKHTESLQKMQKRTSKEIHAKNTIELAAAEELANTRLEQINECRNKLSSSMQREKTLKKKILDIEKDICSRDKEHEAKVQEILTNANRLERKNDELKSELMLRKGEITRIESILEGKSSKLESMENEFNNLLKDISDKNDTIRDLINSLRGAKESLLLLENKAHSDRENIINEYEISLKKKEESLIQAHIRALTDKEADIISRDKLIRKQQEENAILKASFDEMKRIDDGRVLELTRMKNATELLSNSSTVEVTMLQKLVKDKMDEIERMQAELHETKTTLNSMKSHSSIGRDDGINNVSQFTTGLMENETSNRITVLEDKVSFLTRQNEVLLLACEMGANQSIELREALYRSQNSSVNSSVKNDERLQFT